MRILFLALMLTFALSVQVYAQDEGTSPEAAAEASEVDAASPAADDFQQRLDLAKEMHKIRPTKQQVDAAVESISVRIPADQRDAFKANMRSILNYNAIEKISINAMAETFSIEELEAMVEYNKKPEAQSAADKMSEYQSKVSPEIIQMIDKAIMRMRTGTE